MAQLGHIAARIAAAIAGMFLLYTAAFLYENEQGKVQNKLEEWWVRLIDRQSNALSRHAAFMQAVAQLATRGFDRLFGERLFSLQAVGVSVCFSISSCLLAVLTIEYFWLPDWLRIERDQLVAGVVWAAAFLALGIFPALRNRKPLNAWYASVLVAVVPMLLFMLGNLRIAEAARSGRGSASWVWEVAAFALIFLGGFACDIAFIAVTRWSLRWSSGWDRFYEPTVVVIVSLAVSVLLVVLPLLIVRNISEKGLSTLVWPDGMRDAVGWTVALSNTIDTLAAIVFLTLAFGLVLHRILWPLLNRPLYAFASLGIARRRKLLSIAGVGLVGYGGLGLPDLLKKIIEAVLS